ncbi:Zinc finger CCCH-type [Penicillium concentricum]|uniref:PAN2-PAN3 deadenylation complex subunit PAN3 n=1 Tax=Penicillium concentricum TaxID=293559 RepID=A0A9X0B262_9EURO|nr:Zinc finger CCCH-type [Penicillium concentricum]KAJ5385505.1 Zinc finger CCCH-type [Penicillium concentricum]
MASAGKPPLEDARRTTGSPKMKSRENAKDTLCRNVTIYGRCRYEDKGCAFNHDPSKLNTNQLDSKKRFNVDSPSFTPSLLSGNGVSAPKKSTAISPKAASAAPFQPRTTSSRSNTSTPTTRSEAMQDWAVADVQEFVPQGFEHVDFDPMYDSSRLGPGANVPIQTPLQGNGNGGITPTGAFDPFVTTPTPMTPGAVGSVSTNPYSHDHSGAMGGAFFANQTGFQQPIQYHLYAPIGPHSQNTLGYQRNVHDLFIPNDLREELQKKSAATLQTLPNTQLPAQVDYFHSLVPLDLSHQKNAATFGYPSWIYKAQSSKDGTFYALRRLEGFRLTNEKAIRSVQAWKRVCNASVVTIHDAFTSRSFQDSSLIFVTDYHPLSKTLADQHLSAANGRFPTRPNAHIPEQILWGYMTQIANGLKAIHASGLAARVLEPSKVLITAKTRIRINACAILDVVQFDTQRTVADLQRQDLVNFGQMIVTLGANSPTVIHNPTKAMEHFTRAYSPQLKNSVFWLLNGLQKDQERTIDTFITGISSQLMSTFDSALHLDDQLTSDLGRELENGRLVRLISKLGLINERPEYELDQRWSESGERYFLKLFRDYVFHSVDSQGDAVTDLAHIITCMNKLDAGTEEKIHLISRDEQSCLIVSYKEVKKALESSFQALSKPARRMH